jgi:serine/threonine protein kinase
MDGGSLADVLHAAQLTGSGPLSEMVLGKLAARTLAGLNYLHRERHQVCPLPTKRLTCDRTAPL